MFHFNTEDIYESAFIAEKWPDILDGLGRAAGAIGGGLFVANGDVHSWTASAGLKDTMLAFVDNKILQNMGRKPKLYDAGQHGFVTEEDVFSPEELNNHPLYRDFLRPKGLGWSARTAVRLPTGDNIIVTLERAFKDGPIPKEAVDEINSIRPHLARAALMSARMQLERVKAATDALALLGLPALTFDVRGRSLAANELVEKMSAQISFNAFGKIALNDKRADALFQQAVDCASKQNYAVPLSFSVCSSEGIPEKIAHIIPICGDSRDVFLRSAGMLVLTPIVSAQSLSIDLVQSLFDFTAAEARVACNVAKGATAEEIAVTNAISVSTVRAQIRSILEKTGCHRQLELASLLNGLSIVRN